MIPQLTAYQNGPIAVVGDQLNTFVQTAGTAADMRGLIGLTGMSLFANGITTFTDGLAGTFTWDASAVGPDDNLNIIVPYGAAIGAWVRVSGSGFGSQILVTPQQFGAVGNGIANDTSPVQRAQSAAATVFTPLGKYLTTIAPNAFTGMFEGFGQIIDSAGNQRGKIFTTLQSAPSLGSNPASIETAFNGDMSHVPVAIEHRIYGSATLGQPATGYLYNDNCYPVFGFMLNTSGWNQSTSGNDGRTAAVFSRIFVTQSGQGDAVAYNSEVAVTTTKAGVTSWLAYPAGVNINGDCGAAVDGCYLNVQEMAMNDFGHDVAAIGLVHNLFRTNNTGGLGAPWIGYRIQSIGSQNVDAAISMVGPYFWGIDTSTATFSSNQAIGVKASDRIYMNVTASDGSGFPRSSVPGSVYLTYNSGSQLLSMVNGSALWSLSPTGATTNSQTIFAGIISPSVDNTYSCGTSGFRWTAIWAVNGAIQTSDETLKANILPLPPALPIVAAVNPITWQWIDGGMREEIVQEEQEVPATETVETESQEIQVVAGVAQLVTVKRQVERPITDALPVFDENGVKVMIDVGGKKGPPRWVQRMHHVPRMVKQTVAVKKLVNHPGVRRHWGFRAGDIKAATPEGMDWAAYVKDADGIEHLRPDQLVPVLWQAVNELAAKVAALEAQKGAA